MTLLGFLCRVYHNWTTASATMDVGWGAYTAPSGSAVAASYDGLDDGLDVDTAGQIAIGSALATAGQVKTFESQDGVWITFESKTTAIADGDDLTGYLVYVVWLEERSGGLSAPILIWHKFLTILLEPAHRQSSP